VRISARSAPKAARKAAIWAAKLFSSMIRPGIRAPSARLGWTSDEKQCAKCLLTPANLVAGSSGCRRSGCCHAALSLGDLISPILEITSLSTFSSSSHSWHRGTVFRLQHYDLVIIPAREPLRPSKGPSLVRSMSRHLQIRNTAAIRRERLLPGRRQNGSDLNGHLRNNE
jgi:hypothetical protein